MGDEIGLKSETIDFIISPTGPPPPPPPPKKFPTEVVIGLIGGAFGLGLILALSKKKRK